MFALLICVFALTICNARTYKGRIFTDNIPIVERDGLYFDACNSNHELKHLAFDAGSYVICLWGDKSLSKRYG